MDSTISKRIGTQSWLTKPNRDQIHILRFVPYSACSVKMINLQCKCVGETFYLGSTEIPENTGKRKKPALNLLP